MQRDLGTAKMMDFLTSTAAELHVEVETKKCQAKIFSKPKKKSYQIKCSEKLAPLKKQ